VVSPAFIGFPDSEQHADHLHRHLRAQILDEVEPPSADERVQRLRAELTDLGLQGVDLARREHARQQLAVHGVDRRILENQHSRRDLQVRLDDFQDRAAARTEGVVVDHGLIDVRVSAERVEVVAGVVVQRRFVAQTPVRRIGVRNETDVVRVVVDVVLGACRHSAVPSSSRTRLIDASVAAPRPDAGVLYCSLNQAHVARLNQSLDLNSKPCWT
jgi:hypothetical protein